MNPFLIEQKRIELLSTLPKVYGRAKLSLITKFYLLLFECKNEAILNSYGPEFLSDLLLELKNFNSFYQFPNDTEDLIHLLEKIEEYEWCAANKLEIEFQRNRINSNLEKLKKILKGEHCNLITDLTYPLVETNNRFECTFGILESLTVKISKAKGKDSLIFIPSQQKVDEALERQAKVSFELARKYLASFENKFNKYHEILIYFENRSANYEGNSLGIAITIGFVEALANFYNLPYLIRIKPNITSTGGLDKNGNVIEVSPDLIQCKIETVFYSCIDYFVIPKNDLPSAEKRLRELKTIFPKRNLSIIGIESLNDLLDRRSLIEIKKQPLIVRSGKTLKKNWLTSILLTLLPLILIFIWIREFDNNPAILEFQFDQILIKNKSGKLLWDKTLDNISKSNSGEREQLVRLIDIDGDGYNEVLICNEKLVGLENKNHIGRISCFNNLGNIIWEYNFNETLTTKDEIFKDNYVIKMIDTLTENKNKVLYLFANYQLLYPAVIFKVDLQTGKRLDGELWNPGAIYSALIKRNKINDDEIIIGCANNSLKLPCIFSVSTDKLFGENFSTQDYHFIGKNKSQLNNCIFLPKTDYSIFRRQYINMFSPGSLIDNVSEKSFWFNIYEGEQIENAMLVYKMDYNFRDINIIVNSNFRVRRDSLVAKGILKMPFSDTKEYTTKLKKEILYWDGNIIQTKFK